jgi:AmmeMemoRadiSam system protein B
MRAERIQEPSPATRPPAVAGRFYPDDPAELRDLIEGFLRAAKSPDARTPKAVIAPHAGYVYSGPVAASAFAQFEPARDRIRRVVVLGPSHRVPVRGLAISRARTWRTPLGEVPVDAAALGRIASLPQVCVFDEAHVREHSLEVELPFLQVVLRAFALVPLVVGEAGDGEVAEVIEQLWDGEETRFVISSDLSHYLDYATARKLDSATARAIENLSPDDIGEDQACGRIPIRGFLRAARERGLRARTLDLRNSGDTAGPRHQVVGYGAWAFA